MKTKSVSSIIKATAAVMLFASFSNQVIAAGYQKITRLGGQATSICRPAINTGAELQSFALNQAQDVRDILNSAGWSGNSADLLSALENGQFTEKSYPVGSKFEWMGQRQSGKVIAKSNKIWAGKQAFEAFEVNLVSNCQVHKIVIPKACCNISLVASSALSHPKPSVRSTVNGNMVTVNVQSNGNKTITELIHPNGTKEILDTTGGSWTGELIPGTYRVSSKTVSDCGASAPVVDVFTVAAIPVVVAPTASVPTGLFFAPFIGRQVRAIDPPLIGGQVGYLKPISKNVDFLVQGGASYNIKHDELSLFVDVGLERRIGSNGGFIGGGVGLWDFQTNDYLINGENKYTREDTSYFIHGGANTKWSYNGNAVQWFAEGRVFSDFTDDLAHHNVFKLGLRYHK